jgi:peptide/nickel transport system substrate-binding protein
MTRFVPGSVLSQGALGRRPFLQEAFKNGRIVDASMGAILAFIPLQSRTIVQKREFRLMSDLNRKLNLASKLAQRGKLSRRDFMQLAIAAGLTVPAASAMFSKAVRAEPKKGGQFRIGLGHGATTDSLDPATYPDLMTMTSLWGTCSNSLTVIDNKGEILPDLAESFEPSDGAKKWVFKVRKGVTFHDGKTVTANDVVASYRHHMGEGSKSAAKSLLESITDIKADGDDTVIFTLSGGNADFPFLASDYHIPIMPGKEDGSADWASMNRTGPYKLDKWEPGVRATAKRNPNYHGEAWFDEIEINVISDVSARTNALTSGEVDFIDRCDLKTIDLLKQNPDLEVDSVTGYGHYIFVVNVTQPPFDNQDIRNALKYAIDRQAVVDKVFRGYAVAGNDNPIAPTVKFAINPEPIHKYDPEMARSLLKKAGLETLRVDLSVADAAFPGAVDAATLFQESAKAAGIEINLVKEADDSYWDVVWLKKPFVATYWNGRPTCDWMFTQAYAADAAWNDTFWKNPRFNELLIKARSETDNTKRAAMYAEMQQLVHDDGGLINLVFNIYVNAHSKKIAHGEIASNWDADGARLTSRWWMA